MATLCSTLPHCLRVCSIPSDGLTKTGLGGSTSGASLQGNSQPRLAPIPLRKVTWPRGCWVAGETSAQDQWDLALQVKRMPGALPDPGSSAGAGGALRVKGFYRNAHSDPQCPCPLSATSQVFLDSTGEAQGTTWSLVSSCGLETWGRLAHQGCQGSIFPSRALGMLSCYIQEDSGPDMQKTWEKGCLMLFFF